MNEITTIHGQSEPTGVPPRFAPDPTTAPDWSRLALEGIKFDRHPTRGLCLKMPGHYWVTAATLRATWHLFWRSVHKLDVTATHKAEQLACTPDWDDRPIGERIAIGRCFKHFAVHGVLPITLVNPEKMCNFKYRLNDGLKPSPTTH